MRMLGRVVIDSGFGLGGSGLARHVSAVSAAFLLLLAAPALAVAAPTVDADYACYTPGMAQHVTGTGFTPGGEVKLSFWVLEEGEFQGSFTFAADAAGAIDRWMRTPEFGIDRGDAMLMVEDLTLQSQGAPPDQFSAAIILQLSQWDVTVARWGGSPAKAKPGRHSKITAVGWVGTASTDLYVHYLRKKRLLKTIRVGGLRGDCGDMSGRIREFPFKPVKPGTYRVVFDTTKRYPNDDASIAYKRVAVRRADAVAAWLAWDPIDRLRADPIGGAAADYR